MARTGLYKYVHDGEIIYIGMSAGKTCGIDERIAAHATEEKFKPYLNGCEIYFAQINKASSVIKSAESLLINQYAPVLNVSEKPEVKDETNYEALLVATLGLEWKTWKKEERVAKAPARVKQLLAKAPPKPSATQTYIDRIKKALAECEKHEVRNADSMTRARALLDAINNKKYKRIERDNYEGGKEQLYIIDYPITDTESSFPSVAYQTFERQQSTGELTSAESGGINTSLHMKGENDKWMFASSRNPENFFASEVEELQKYADLNSESCRVLRKELDELLALQEQDKKKKEALQERAVKKQKPLQERNQKKQSYIDYLKEQIDHCKGAYAWNDKYMENLTLLQEMVANKKCEKRKDCFGRTEYVIKSPFEEMVGEFPYPLTLCGIVAVRAKTTKNLVLGRSHINPRFYMEDKTFVLPEDFSLELKKTPRTH